MEPGLIKGLLHARQTPYLLCYISAPPDSVSFGRRPGFSGGYSGSHETLTNDAITPPNPGSWFYYILKIHCSGVMSLPNGLSDSFPQKHLETLKWLYSKNFWTSNRLMFSCWFQSHTQLCRRAILNLCSGVTSGSSAWVP